MARNPDGSSTAPPLFEMLDQAGINPIKILEKLNRTTDRKRPDPMTFPPYDTAKAAKRARHDPAWPIFDSWSC